MSLWRPGQDRTTPLPTDVPRAGGPRTNDTLRNGSAVRALRTPLVTEAQRQRAQHVATVLTGTAEAWLAWLRRTKWDWWMTGTGTAIAGSAEAARRAATGFVEDLRTPGPVGGGGRPQAYAAVVIEQGAALGGWHAHLLLGGLGGHPHWQSDLRDRWKRYGPLAHVTRYNPAQEGIGPDPSRSGACAYVLKGWPAVEVEVLGRWQRWRPRR